MNKLYNLFIAEMMYLEDISYFASQSIKNPDECGQLVELGMRKFLKEVIGQRFKITHGYIYSSTTEKRSSQIDIIITDTLVTHSFKRFDYLDGLEIVPIEAVVAIFEIKRTLSKQTLLNATNSLKKIIEDLGLSKQNDKNYLPGGIELKGSNGISLKIEKYSNPMVGIIALKHEGDSTVLKKELPWFMDIVFSFNINKNKDSNEIPKGFLIAPKDPENHKSILMQPYRKSTELLEYHDLLGTEENNPLRLFISCILQYLSQTSGRELKVQDYLKIKDF